MDRIAVRGTAFSFGWGEIFSVEPTGENRNIRTETCPNNPFSLTNPTGTALVANADI
jgi:hypothetical protein